MTQLTIGIDRTDDQLIAVVVAGTGKDARVRGCASVLLEEQDDVARQLSSLLEQIHRQDGGRCISGLSLSMFSLRNFILPFKNEKEIAQILPLELEEHLLQPVSEQIFATTAVSAGDAGSRVLIAAIEKARLRDHLNIFQAENLDPVMVCPSIFVLAERLHRDGVAGENFLLLYGTPDFMTMAVCHEGMIVFTRRLFYSEQVYSQGIFSFDGNRFEVSDTSLAAEAVSIMREAVQRSMEYFSRTVMLDIKPDQIILAGPMAFSNTLCQRIEQEFGLRSTLCNLVESGNLVLADHLADNWQPSIYDSALALALLRPSRQAAMNFRKDEFKAGRSLIGSRKQLAALVLCSVLLGMVLFGYLFIDYKGLKKEYDEQAVIMKEVFHKSFPEVTRIVDPVAQMQAKLREREMSMVSMPLFTSEKRVLTILTDISSRIPADVSIHVSRLLIDQDTVKIKGTTDAFNNVNRIKNLLARSPRFSEVNIVSATKAKKKNVIRFEITLRLGENG